MSGESGVPDRMVEVLSLSEALSHRVLNSVLADAPIPRHQASALIKAAQLLRDAEVPWPFVLEQALHEVVEHARRARAGSERHEPREEPSDGSGNPLRSIPILGRLFGSSEAN